MSVTQGNSKPCKKPVEASSLACHLFWLAVCLAYSLTLKMLIHSSTVLGSIHAV
jgi:hypothetical protein